MSNVFWGASAIQHDPDQQQPSLLLVGDSWFWYPVDNLAVEIAAKLSQQVLLVVGRSGAEAGEWATKYRKEIERTFDLYASGVRGLLISGGGNDIAGTDDFTRLLKPDCSGAKRVEDCWRAGQPDAAMALIDGAYRALIAKFRAANPAAPAFVHQYDDAWPTGKGFFGPGDWLKVPMDVARVPAKLRRPLFADLIARLKALQTRMASEPALKVVVMNTQGVLPSVDDSMWANELHPTPAGFRLLVKKAVLPALRANGIG
jgi:GDSL-like Lipase/Acylhydrolase family